MVKKRAYNVNELIKKEFDIMHFQGAWQKTLGKPCKQFSMMIKGKSSQGKTTFGIQLCKYLTNYGTVAYNSLEEGMSHTLKMAMLRNEMDQVSDKFQILDKESLNELTARLRKQRSPDFTLIDSAQYLNITKDEYLAFKDEFYGKKGIIFISHEEGSDVVGALAKLIWYDVDIHINVEGFKAFPSKRLNGGGEPYIINAERAAKHHGDII